MATAPSSITGYDSRQFAFTLDERWVDHILVTAFDGNYGGCWYWINEDEDVKRVRIAHGQPDPVLEGHHLWSSVELDLTIDPHEHGEWREEILERSRGVVAVLDWRGLSYACAKVLNDAHLVRTVTGRQFAIAAETPGELPDLDAEACDVLVQLALFGQVIYA